MEKGTDLDNRKLSSLSKRIQSRFRVCAKPINGSASGTGVVVAILENSEREIGQKLDAISDFCEESGFGRIDSETSMLEHIDMLEEV